MGNLTRRVIVALIGIPVAALLVYAGELPLALFLGAFGALGATELFALARRNGVEPLAVPGAALAAGAPLLAHAARLGVVDAPLTVVSVLAVAVAGMTLWARQVGERPLETVAVTLLGAAYCGGTLVFGYELRHHRFVVSPVGGAVLVMFPLVLTWATDTGAYAFGRWLGRRKLMPSVSPGKTVAGALGGSVVAIVAAVLYNSQVLRPQAQLALAPWTAPVFGLVVSVVAQVGDLVESLFKREAGVKDSGSLLPGHGGVLDRLDSIYFVLPVAYLILTRLLLAAP